MPQKKGMTKEERALLAEQRAKSLRNQSRFDRVAAVFKLNGAKLYEIEKDLIREGLLEEEAKVQTPRKMVALCDANDDEGGGEKDSKGKTVEEDADFPDDVPVVLKELSLTQFDRNKSQYKDIAVKTIQFALAACAPIELSLAQQQRLLKKGARNHNTQVLCRLLELFTGISAETRIDVGDRNNRSVGINIYRAYIECSNRARGFDLAKINFETGEGLTYSLSFKGTVCTVTHRYSEESRCFTVPRMIDLYIDLNWIETKAVVRQVKGKFRKPLYPLFIAQNSSSCQASAAAHDPSKRPAIEDGVLALENLENPLTPLPKRSCLGSPLSAPYAADLSELQEQKTEKQDVVAAKKQNTAAAKAVAKKERAFVPR